MRRLWFVLGFALGAPQLAKPHVPDSVALR